MSFFSKFSHVEFTGELKSTDIVCLYILATLKTLHLFHTLTFTQRLSELRPRQTRTHCCRHKCFPVGLHAQHLLRTQILYPGHIKMFLILFRDILCPQQMFPSLRSPRNIIGNNVSTTMCPRLPGP